MKRYHRISDRWYAVIFIAGILLSGVACNTNTIVTSTPAYHQSSVSRPGAVIYVDRIDNRSVLATDDTTMNSNRFYSFLIGMRDSSSYADKKRGAMLDKYFQYDMEKDWVAIVHGDSLRPVFFVQKTGLAPLTKEAVIIFEVSRELQPDTLVYKDAFGSWGTQIFIPTKQQQ